MDDFYFGKFYKVPDKVRGKINDKLRDMRKDYGSFRKYLDKIEVGKIPEVPHILIAQRFFVDICNYRVMYSNQTKDFHPLLNLVTVSLVLFGECLTQTLDFALHQLQR